MKTTDPITTATQALQVWTDLKINTPCKPSKNWSKNLSKKLKDKSFVAYWQAFPGDLYRSTGDFAGRICVCVGLAGSPTSLLSCRWFIGVRPVMRAHVHLLIETGGDHRDLNFSRHLKHASCYPLTNPLPINETGTISLENDSFQRFMPPLAILYTRTNA